jgi:hypothetical protein
VVAAEGLVDLLAGALAGSLLLLAGREAGGSEHQETCQHQRSETRYGTPAFRNQPDQFRDK